MLYFLIVGLIFGTIIYLTNRKEREDKKIDLDLSQEVQLRFLKDEYGEYEVQFFNPVKKRWWTLPSGYAGIHAPWSFRQRGSYGAYSLERLTCTHYEIENVKNQYSTLEAVQNLFDRMNKDYEDFEKRKAIRESRPNVIR